MTAGASRAATKITSQPALAPSPQPRPAPTGRALIAQNVGKGGPFRMPIRGPDWMPIDNLYTGHFWHHGWSIVDVSDPRNPHVERFIEGPRNTATLQVTLFGDTLIT